MSKSNGNGQAKRVEKQRAATSGGITGKGFVKGKSGNPAGRPARAEIVGKFIRDWLDKRMIDKDDGNKAKRRLLWLIEKIAKDDPKVLLHYAYGKPAEMIQLADAEGNPIEFKLAVTGAEVP